MLVILRFVGWMPRTVCTRALSFEVSGCCMTFLYVFQRFFLIAYRACEGRAAMRMFPSTVAPTAAAAAAATVASRK
jgi:hypothetical protein